MAKVKKVEGSNLKSAKPIKAASKPESAKVTKVPAKPRAAIPNSVTAIKNGNERTFSRQIWDHLPQGKEGWAEVKDAPPIPQKPKPATEDSPAQSYNDAVKAYTELFGEAPGQDLSIEDLDKAIADKKGEQNNG